MSGCTFSCLGSRKKAAVWKAAALLVLQGFHLCLAACKNYGNSKFGCDAGQYCTTFGDTTGSRDPNAASWSSEGICRLCPPDYYCLGGQAATSDANPAPLRKCPVGKFVSTSGATSETACLPQFTRCQIASVPATGSYVYTLNDNLLAAISAPSTNIDTAYIYNASSLQR